MITNYIYTTSFNLRPSAPLGSPEESSFPSGNGGSVFCFREGSTSLCPFLLWKGLLLHSVLLSSRRGVSMCLSQEYPQEHLSANCPEDCPYIYCSYIYTHLPLFRGGDLWPPGKGARPAAALMACSSPFPPLPPNNNNPSMVTAPVFTHVAPALSSASRFLCRMNSRPSFSREKTRHITASLAALLYHSG